MYLQAALYSMLEKAGGCDGQSAAEELQGLRALVGMVLTGEQASISLHELRIVPRPWGEGRHRVEFMRLPGRQQILQACGRLLDDWPRSFRSIARELGLRQDGFKRHDPMPAWLVSEVERLPCVKTRTVQTRRSSLEQKLETLSAGKPNNWRTLRAALMIRAVRRWP